MSWYRAPSWFSSPWRGYGAAHLLSPGTRLGPYRIVRKLGSGGMGTVYEARHTHIGRQVALKVLHPYLSHDEEMVTRLLHEAHTSNLIHHSGVVQITDHHRLRDGKTYLVMEFLDGETLRARLRRGPPLTAAEVLSIGGQLAAALAAAHDQGVIHRDLKPENLMLVQNGQRVKILDFGIARAAGYESHLTGDGRRLGTPTYMAPEQCAGEKARAAGDVYALGALLYELCAGRPPFISEDQGALYGMHRYEEPRHLSEHAPQTSEALVLLIHAMLTKDPTARPTMAEVVIELKALGAPEGIESVPATGQTGVLVGVSYPASEVRSIQRGVRANTRGALLRRWLPRVAGAGIVGGASWFGWTDVTIAQQIHYWTVSRAIQDTLQLRSPSTDPVGRRLDSGFYCAWFQRFRGGKVLYTSGSVDGLPASHYEHTFFVLSTESATRWAMLQEMNYQPVRDRDLFLRDVADGRSNTPDIGLPKPFAKLPDIGSHFRVYAYASEPHPAVAGSIARLYALQALDSVLGTPLDDECRTTVTIQTHEKAIIIGGAPHDTCGETDGIYLLNAESQQPHLTQGHWSRSDRQPLWGDVFHRDCPSPTTGRK